MSPVLSADVVCRRVGLNRMDDLLSLEHTCFSCDRISRRNLRNLLLSPSAYCLGVYHDGDLVGSMVVLFRRYSRIGRIYSIAILPAFRGMGIARKLLARAEREARVRGCTRLRLEVRMDNIPAIRLYESLGFESAQVLPGYYEDGTHGMVYRKDLN